VTGVQTCALPIYEALDEGEGRAPGSAIAQKVQARSADAGPRRIRARYRGGVLYLLEDVELPDGTVVDVSLYPLSKP